MKKIIIVLLVALISVPALPQVFKFGIKGGAESSNVPVYDVVTGGTNPIVAAESSSWGFHAGVFARIKILAIYLQPEVVFASNTFSYNVTENALTTLKDQKFNRLSVPLLVGIKLGPVHFNLGPAAGIQIGSPEALLSSSTNFENLYKGAVWGWQGGVGLDFLKRLTLDVRYAGTFGDTFGDSVPIGTQTFKLDNGTPSWVFSLGIFF